MTTDDPKKCELPPAGWHCTRAAGHEGPCAAVKTPTPAHQNALDTAVSRFRQDLKDAQLHFSEHHLTIAASFFRVYAEMLLGEKEPSSENVVPDEEKSALCETCGEYTKDCCCAQNSQGQLSRADLPVIQSWVCGLPLMQQSVLLTAVRGPDGIAKYGPDKMLLRWYRRCVLLGSFERRVLTTPHELGGGSFTGPSVSSPSFYKSPDTAQDWVWEHAMDQHVAEYLKSLDALPHHFQLHFMHAAEIVGYKHPDKRIREWWCEVYYRLVNDMHLHVETKEELDNRLGDTREGWLNRADPATTE